MPNHNNTFFMEEGWFRTGWRPFLAWSYAFISIFDFLLAPFIMIVLPLFTHGAYVPWVPLTLTNGGLFHLSFGAFATVTSWGRRDEKLKLMEAVKPTSPAVIVSAATTTPPDK